MKKVLIVSTVSRQFYLFEQSNIEVLKDLGYEVHAAANFEDSNERLESLDLIKHNFSIERSPFKLKNLKAYTELKAIMKSEKFDMIHCHSPMGGVLARLAAKDLGISTVIYSAHGFHFYKGAPKINWLLYYPIEKFLAQSTDVLITINNEDFEKAKDFKAREVVHIPGIGIDTKKFEKAKFDKMKKRKELGVSENTKVLLSIGELIKRKNHESAIRAISEIKNEKIVYLICGKGELDHYLKNLVITLGVEDKVKFLGYRNDIVEICLISDVFIFPSYQEGLPVSVMEAMAAGLPILCSSIRGNTDLIEQGEGGFLYRPDDTTELSQSILKLIENPDLFKRMGERNIEEVKKYDKKIVEEIMRFIYSKF